MDWVREVPARWDKTKADVLGDLPPELFGLGRPTEGDALADEWWRVEDAGEVLGYGRLDDTWGDAEILMLVAPERRANGIGSFILSRLEAEAAARARQLHLQRDPAAPPRPGVGDRLPHRARVRAHRDRRAAQAGSARLASPPVLS